MSPKAAAASLVTLALASLALPTTSGQQPLHQDCGLYLAPSSRPRRSAKDPEQWGMYAGKAYMANDTIGFPDVAIAVHAFRAHNTEDADEDDAEHEFLSFIAESVVSNLWEADIAGAASEVDEEDGGCDALLPGAGLLADYNVKLANANFDVRSSYQRVTIGDVPGKNHPGRGANSPFYNLVVRATDDIDAGDEIIINFDMGNNNNNGNAAELAVDEDGAINPEVAILEEDYTRIDQTVDQLLEFFQKHDQTVDEAGKIQIYRFMTEDFLEAAVGPIKAKLIEAMLPSHPSDLASVKSAGGIKKYKQLHTKQTGQFKSLDWLERNGMCMDNIRSGASKIPDAGRGAFANRKISKGALVAPTPLFTIPDKVSMEMFELAEDEAGVLQRDDDQTLRGQQLLLNYMYAHPKSTMGFIPTGANVNLINHSDEPNAKMQWSTHAMHVKEYMQLSPVELMNYQSIGVVMEIVALRDIDPDEEITMDYGSSWKEAWKKHTGSFEAKLASGKMDGSLPLRASDLNAKLATEPLRTDDEQDLDPYPERVTIKAFAMTDDDDLSEDGSEEDPFTFHEPDDRTLYDGNSLVEVEILERDDPDEDDDEYTYSIRYLDETSGDILYMTDVPQHAFVFVDDAASGDQFQPEPFRHYIEIPDDVFPQGPWRNLA